MGDHGQATLRSIAEKFGLSVSTVSRALSGKARQYRISEATARRVREEADRLGFAPNQIASSLRLRKTHTFGVIIPDISNSYFAAVARHVAIEARRRGNMIILCDSQEDPGNELEEIGRVAVGLLHDQLGRPPAPQPVGIHLPPTLIERATPRPRHEVPRQ